MSTSRNLFKNMGIGRINNHLISLEVDCIQETYPTSLILGEVLLLTARSV